MKKTTYRIIKSLGIGLFLLLFGVFIYFLIKPQSVEQNQMALSPESDSQNSETLTGNSAPNKAIGFDYQKTPIIENLNA